MDNLKAKRQTLKGSITRIYNFCVNPNSGIDDIAVRISALDDLFAQYGRVQDEIDELTEDMAQQKQEEIYRSEIEDKYFKIKSIHTARVREDDADRTVIENDTHDNNITQAIQAMADSQTSIGVILDRLTTGQGFHSSPINTASIIQSQHHEPRLPQIQIPEFDGTYTDWIRFRDLFDALIHSKATISNVEKLEYLQTRLTGVALSIIKHLKPTNDNYAIAWQLINNKYDKSQQVRRAYLELLFDQPSMQKSTVNETKQLYNNTNESINALKVLNEPTQHWDTILLFHLEKKLDAETHILWCREKRAVSNPTFDSFLGFLNDRVSELESIQQCIHTQPLKTTAPVNRYRNQLGTYAATIQTCIACNESHFIYQCERFKELSIEERYKLIRNHNLCFNCLRPNHVAINCTASSCKTCNAKHNTLLHFIQRQDEDPTHILMHSSEPRQMGKLSYTFLPTAMIMVHDRYGRLQKCRAFLDSCAQHTLITESCAKRLQLNRIYDKTLMYRVGPDQGSYTKGKVHLGIVSTMYGKTITTDALCLPTLARDFPSHNVVSQKFKYFKNLKMADPKFNKSAPVDIIIGAEVYNQIVLSDKVFHPSGSPVAIDTIFGWAIMGTVETQVKSTIFAAHVSIDLNEHLQRSWRIEDVPSNTKMLFEDEKAAKNHYQQHFEKSDNRRYIEKLPFKHDNIELGESGASALKRTKSMERRLTNNIDLKDKNTNFIREYQELHHTEMDQTPDNENGYVVPHHAILKPNISTTKLFNVFDESYETTNRYSLNDQIAVENANHCPAIFPAIPPAITQQFYVDEFTSFSEDVHSAIQLKNDLYSVPSKSKIHTRKWTSDSTEFMQSVDPPDKFTSAETVIEESLIPRTLGPLWGTTADNFRFSIGLQPGTPIMSLSEQITVFMKIFIQKLLLQGINWDQQLPEHVFIQWFALRYNIYLAQDLRVLELHSFANSSELVYSAVIYLRVKHKHGNINTSLFTSNAGVAHVIQMSLSRFELCDVHLSLKFMIRVLAIEERMISAWVDTSLVLAWIPEHSRLWKSFVTNRTSYIIEHMSASQWNHSPLKRNSADLATRALAPSELLQNNLWWNGPNVIRSHNVTEEGFPIVPSKIDMDKKKATSVHFTINRFDNNDSTTQSHNLFELYSKYNKVVHIKTLVLKCTHNCRVGRSNKTIFYITCNELHKTTYRLAQTGQFQTCSNVPLNDVKANHCDRWQFRQNTVQSFWIKWSREYFKQMHQRPKWYHNITNNEDLRLHKMVNYEDN